MTEFKEVVELFRLRAASCKGPHVPECDCNIYKVLSQVEQKDCNFCEYNGRDCESCDDVADKDREIRQIKRERDAAIARVKDAEPMASKPLEKPACVGISTCGSCESACPANG